MEYREYRNTGGTQRTVENREYSVVHGVQRVQEHWRNTENGHLENREYSVVHGVQRVQEHWRKTENGREQRVQCSTWSTESTGTLEENRER